jgi:hypothetical protein
MSTGPIVGCEAIESASAKTEGSAAATQQMGGAASYEICPSATEHRGILRSAPLGYCGDSAESSGIIARPRGRERFAIKCRAAVFQVMSRAASAALSPSAGSADRFSNAHRRLARSDDGLGFGVPEVQPR